MEMEIRKDYKEVLHMLEGVLLHIFRGIKGKLLSVSFIGFLLIKTQSTALPKSNSSAPSIPPQSFSFLKPERRFA